MMSFMASVTTSKAAVDSKGQAVYIHVVSKYPVHKGVYEGKNRKCGSKSGPGSIFFDLIRNNKCYLLTL